jgi:hypothetical protein
MAKDKDYNFTKAELAWQEFFRDWDVEKLVAATVPAGNEFYAENIRAAARHALRQRRKAKD